MSSAFARNRPTNCHVVKFKYVTHVCIAFVLVVLLWLRVAMLMIVCCRCTAQPWAPVHSHPGH